MCVITRQVLLLGVLLGAVTARGDVRDQLGDLAARIDFGFYAHEPAIIAAARSELEQLKAGDPRVDYYRAYAILRQAQTSRGPGGASDARLEDCFDAAEAAADEAAGDSVTAGEAWILLAACSLVAAERESLKAVLHNRRVDNALENARALADQSPRLYLVQAWRLDDEPKQADDYLALLEQARAAADSLQSGDDWPDWGEAEIMARLAAHQLAAGDWRGARDYAERALIIAPDYEEALEITRELGIGGR